MTADDRSLGQDAPAVRVAAPRRRGMVSLALLDAEGRLRVGWRMLGYLTAWSLGIGVASELLVGPHPTPARQLLALVAIPVTVAVTYGFRRWVDRRDWRGIGLPWPRRQQLAAGKLNLAPDRDTNRRVSSSTEVPPMAMLALVLLAAWLLLVAGLPTLIQTRRTGTASTPRFRDRSGSPQWWARLVSTIGFACAVAAPLAELAGLQPITFLDRTPVRTAGVVLVVCGIAATLAAQLAMGASWRPDVDPTTRTALVTSGPFRLVRNPIFTATAATAAGLALLVPNVVAAAMLVALVTALQIQVRLVEEPYLRRVHGGAWEQYAARTGRFLPGIGRHDPGTGSA